jgi:hypothetical protein
MPNGNDNDNNSIGGPGEGNETDGGLGGLNQEGGGGLNLGGSGINGWGDNYSDGMAEYNADHGPEEAAEQEAAAEGTEPTIVHEYMGHKLDFGMHKDLPQDVFGPYYGAIQTPAGWAVRPSASKTVGQSTPQEDTPRVYVRYQDDWLTAPEPEETEKVALFARPVVDWMRDQKIVDKNATYLSGITGQTFRELSPETQEKLRERVDPFAKSVIDNFVVAPAVGEAMVRLAPAATFLGRSTVGLGLAYGNAVYEKMNAPLQEHPGSLYDSLVVRAGSGDYD